MSSTRRARRYLVGAVVTALALLLVSPLLVVVPLIGYAVWVGRARRRMLAGLLVALLLGGGDVVLQDHYYRRHDCGVRYDPDLGCMNVLPGWLVPFGFAMLAVAVVLSIVLVASALRRRGQTPRMPA